MTMLAIGHNTNTLKARIGNPYVVLNHADDAAAQTYINYTSLAAAYALLVTSLPAPPAQADGKMHLSY